MRLHFPRQSAIITAHDGGLLDIHRDEHSHRHGLDCLPISFPLLVTERPASLPVQTDFVNQG